MIAGTEAIAVRVDAANPGQYFACCGLLELANRMWPGTEGWFAGGEFQLRGGGSAAELMRALRTCDIANTMSDAQKRRREELGAMGQKAVKADPRLEAEKKGLDSLWRESPVVFGRPFDDLRVDWFLDARSGGKSFKTWAGQQSIIDIVTTLREVLPDSEESGNWLATVSATECVPLNFDSNLGGASADLDVGFSFDPLKSAGVRVAIRPAIEFLAFAGLQRFRPRPAEGAWEYCLWEQPSGVEAGGMICCGAVERLASRMFRFDLLYRTKYLKSFLAGRPV